MEYRYNERRDKNNENKKFQAYSGMMVKEESSEQLIKTKYV